MHRVQRRLRDVVRRASSNGKVTSPTAARLRRRGGTESPALSRMLKKEESRRLRGEVSEFVPAVRQKDDDIQSLRDYNNSISEIMNLVNGGADHLAVRTAVSVLEKRNIISKPGQWIRVLQALSAVKDGEGAAELLRRIPGGATTSMYNTALRACARGGNADIGRALFDFMDTDPFTPARPDSITLATAMALESRYNDRASRLMRRAFAAAISEQEHTSVDRTGAQLAYREAFRLCGKGKQWQVALDLLVSELGPGPKNGARPEERDVEQVATICADAGQRPALLELLQWAAELGIDSDRAHAQYIIALANAAAEYRTRSPTERRKLAEVAIAAVENLRKKRQDQRMNISLHISPPSSLVTNAALRACAAAAAPDICLTLFEQCKEERDRALDSGASYAALLAPDIVTYLWTMRAVANGAKEIENPGEKCLDLLADAASRGISPNAALCSAVLQALALQPNSAELASQLVAEMDNRHIKLTATGAAALVRCLASGEKRPDAAIEVFKTHLSQHPDSSALWISAFDACRMQINEADQLDPEEEKNEDRSNSPLETTRFFAEEAPMHPWVQVAAARALAAAGDWEHVCSIVDDCFSDENADELSSSQRAARSAAYSAAIEACFNALEAKERPLDADDDIPMLGHAKQTWVKGANRGLYARPSVGKGGKVITLDVHGASPAVAKAAILSTFEAYYKDNASQKRIPTLCLLTGARKKRAVLRPALEHFLSFDLQMKFQPAPKNPGVLVIASASVEAYNKRPAKLNYPFLDLSTPAPPSNSDTIISIHDYMTKSQPIAPSDNAQDADNAFDILGDNRAENSRDQGDDDDDDDENQAKLFIDHIDDEGGISFVDEDGNRQKLTVEQLADFMDIGDDDDDADTLDDEDEDTEADIKASSPPRRAD